MEARNKTITAYFDFETYNLTDFKFGEEPIENGDKSAILDKPIAVYGAGLGYEGQIFIGFGLDAIDKFGKKIIHLAKGQKINLLAHNCGYDFACLNEYGHNNNCTIKSITAAQTDDERAGLGARVKVDDVEIKFLDSGIGDKNCSLSYYTDEVLSLDETKRKGRLEDYEKGNLFEKNNKIYFYDRNGEIKELDYEAEKAYLINDVEALPQVKEYIDKTKKLILKSDFIPDESEGIYEFREINNKLTKASFAKTCFELCCKEFFYQGVKQEIPEELYGEQVKSFVGGFTSGNKNITYLDFDEEKIKCYDVNSMYPAMMTLPLPGGPILYGKPKEPHYVGCRITGTKCKYKKKYEFLDCPIISVSFQEWLNNNKKGIESGRLIELPTFIILKDYLDIINEYTDNDLKIVEKFYQVKENKLAPHIQSAYDLRVLVKDTNKPLAASIKLFLNSGFGKFSEKTHEKFIEGDPKLKCGNKVLSKEHDRYTNLLAGIFICSMARIKLMKAIRDEIDNGNTFLYCDTDSVGLVENNKPKFEIDKNELGCGKCEGAFTGWAYPLKRKRYYGGNKHNGNYKFASGGFAKVIIDDLPHEHKLIFYDPTKNTVVRGGKRTRYLGYVRDKFLTKQGKEKKEKPKLNRYGLTKLFTIDVSTSGTLEDIDAEIAFDNKEKKGKLL